MYVALYIASLVIYVILFKPTIYCLWKHGKPGLLGWFYVHTFCFVRILGNGISIHDQNKHSNGPKTSTTIINNIGLSPLILAVAGILHEAYIFSYPAQQPRPKKKLEIFAIIQYHVLVSAATILIIVGIIRLTDGKNDSATSAFLKTGSICMILAWLVIVVLVGILALRLRKPNQDQVDTVQRQSYGLIKAVIVALPLIALRLAYAVTSLMLDIDDPSASFLRSLAVKVCLSVVPEMLVTIILVLIGLSTRDIRKHRTMKQAIPMDRA